MSKYLRKLGHYKPMETNGSHMNFVVGNGEFGEVYHLAIAASLDRNVRVHFAAFDKGKEFFSDLGLHHQILDDRPESHTPLTKSAKILCKHYTADTPKQLVARLSRLAKGWSLPAIVANCLSSDPSILLWVRERRDYKPYRNTTKALIKQVSDLAAKVDSEVIPVGKGLGLTKGTGLVQFWEEPWFSDHCVAKQLWCLDTLFREGGTVASVGMMSGAMDGLALFHNRPTIFIARKRDAAKRMRKIAEAVRGLRWLRADYSGDFERLSKSEVTTLKRMIWPNNGVENDR